MTTAPTRPQPLQDTTRIKTHGHLALLEWENLSVPTAALPIEISLYRRTADRWYTGGTLLLFVTTIAALAASLCRF